MSTKGPSVAAVPTAAEAPVQPVDESGAVESFTVFQPSNFEELVTTQTKGRVWLSHELILELEQRKPKVADINVNGCCDVARLAEECGRILVPGRIFCSQRQLEAMLLEFSQAWGFAICRSGKRFCCHFSYRYTTKNPESKISPETQRQGKVSTKQSIDCPFCIHFSHITRHTPAAYFNEQGKIKTTDFYPVKITRVNLDHTCKPSAATQRFAIAKSGRAQPRLTDVQDIIEVLRECPALSNATLRALLKSRLVHHAAMDDQFLRNFRHRVQRFIQDGG